MPLDLNPNTFSPELADRLSTSHQPLIIEVNNTTIVGEIHLKTSSDETIENKFQQILNDSEFIIIEHQSSPGDYFSQNSSHKRFMQQAQDHSLETGKQILILDNQIRDRHQLWLDCGLDISQKKYNFLLGIYMAVDDFANSESQTNSLNKLFNYYKNFDKNVKDAQKMAIATYQSVFSPDEIENISEKVQLAVDFNKLYVNASEIFYQKKLISVSKNIGQRKAVIVVGQDHAKPIAKSLIDHSLTPANTELLRQVKDTVSLIEEKYHLNNI